VPAIAVIEADGPTRRRHGYRAHQRLTGAAAGATSAFLTLPPLDAMPAADAPAEVDAATRERLKSLGHAP
jgi:hypothetical protein